MNILTKNKIIIRIVTFVVITALLCQNIAWAEGYEMGVSKAKLSSKSFLKFVEEHAGSESGKYYMKADALDGYLKETARTDKLHRKRKLFDMPEWIGEDEFIEFPRREPRETGNYIIFDVIFLGRRSELYLFNDLERIGINPDIGIETQKHIEIAKERGYWFRIISERKVKRKEPGTGQAAVKVAETGEGEVALGKSSRFVKYIPILIVAGIFMCVLITLIIVAPDAATFILADIFKQLKANPILFIGLGIGCGLLWYVKDDIVPALREPVHDLLKRIMPPRRPKTEKSGEYFQYDYKLITGMEIDDITKGVGLTPVQIEELRKLSLKKDNGQRYMLCRRIIKGNRYAGFVTVWDMGRGIFYVEFTWSVRTVNYHLSERFIMRELANRDPKGILFVKSDIDTVFVDKALPNYIDSSKREITRKMKEEVFQRLKEKLEIKDIDQYTYFAPDVLDEKKLYFSSFKLSSFWKIGEIEHWINSFLDGLFYGLAFANIFAHAESLLILSKFTFFQEYFGFLLTFGLVWAARRLAKIIKGGWVLARTRRAGGEGEDAWSGALRNTRMGEKIIRTFRLLGYARILLSALNILLIPRIGVKIFGISSPWFYLGLLFGSLLVRSILDKFYYLFYREIAEFHIKFNEFARREGYVEAFNNIDSLSEAFGDSINACGLFIGYGIFCSVLLSFISVPLAVLTAIAIPLFSFLIVYRAGDYNDYLEIWGSGFIPVGYDEVLLEKGIIMKKEPDNPLIKESRPEPEPITVRSYRLPWVRQLNVSIECDADQIPDIKIKNPKRFKWLRAIKGRCEIKWPKKNLRIELISREAPIDEKDVVIEDNPTCAGGCIIRFYPKVGVKKQRAGKAAKKELPGSPIQGRVKSSSTLADKIDNVLFGKVPFTKVFIWTFVIFAFLAYLFAVAYTSIFAYYYLLIPSAWFLWRLFSLIPEKIEKFPYTEEKPGFLDRIILAQGEPLIWRVMPYFTAFIITGILVHIGTIFLHEGAHYLTALLFGAEHVDFIMQINFFSFERVGLVWTSGLYSVIGQIILTIAGSLSEFLLAIGLILVFYKYFRKSKVINYLVNGAVVTLVFGSFIYPFNSAIGLSGKISDWGQFYNLTGISPLFYAFGFLIVTVMVYLIKDMLYNKSHRQKKDGPGLIGKYKLTSVIEFIEEDPMTHKGYIRFNAHHIEDPKKKVVEVKIGAQRVSKDIFGNFRKTDIPEIDDALQKFLSNFSKDAFLLAPNQYGIDGIGTEDVLAVSETLAFNFIALFHELAHAAGIDVTPGGTDITEISQHYALRLFQKQKWPKEDRELTRLIKMNRLFNSRNRDRDMEIACDLDLDTRPTESWLLRVPFVGHDMAVKDRVNPLDEHKVAVYGCSGDDISHILLLTNADTLYFVDTTDVNFDLLEEKLGDWENIDFSSYLMRKKYSSGHSGSSGRRMSNIEYKLIRELKGMGVRKEDIEIDKENRIIRFKWAYHEKSPRPYSITFITADITKPKKYPESLERVLASGVDIYYQRASGNAPDSYKQYMPEIARSIREGGFILTDDFAYRGGYGDYVDLDPILAECGVGFTKKGEAETDETKMWQKIIEKTRVRHPERWEYGAFVHIRTKIATKGSPAERLVAQGAARELQDIFGESPTTHESLVRKIYQLLRDSFKICEDVSTWEESFKGTPLEEIARGLQGELTKKGGLWLATRGVIRQMVEIAEKRLGGLGEIERDDLIQNLTEEFKEGFFTLLDEYRYDEPGRKERLLQLGKDYPGLKEKVKTLNQWLAEQGEIMQVRLNMDHQGTYFDLADAIDRRLLSGTEGHLVYDRHRDIEFLEPGINAGNWITYAERDEFFRRYEVRRPIKAEAPVDEIKGVASASVCFDYFSYYGEPINCGDPTKRGPISKARDVFRPSSAGVEGMVSQMMNELLAGDVDIRLFSLAISPPYIWPEQAEIIVDRLIEGIKRYVTERQKTGWHQKQLEELIPSPWEEDEPVVTEFIRGALCIEDQEELQQMDDKELCRKLYYSLEHPVFGLGLPGRPASQEVWWEHVVRSLIHRVRAREEAGILHREIKDLDNIRRLLQEWLRREWKKRVEAEERWFQGHSNGIGGVVNGRVIKIREAEGVDVVFYRLVRPDDSPEEAAYRVKQEQKRFDEALRDVRRKIKRRGPIKNVMRHMVRAVRKQIQETRMNAEYVFLQVVDRLIEELRSEGTLVARGKAQFLMAHKSNILDHLRHRERLEFVGDAPEAVEERIEREIRHFHYIIDRLIRKKKGIESNARKKEVQEMMGFHLCHLQELKAELGGGEFLRKEYIGRIRREKRTAASLLYERHRQLEEETKSKEHSKFREAMEELLLLELELMELLQEKILLRPRASVAVRERLKKEEIARFNRVLERVRERFAGRGETIDRLFSELARDVPGYIEDLRFTAGRAIFEAVSRFSRPPEDEEAVIETVDILIEEIERGHFRADMPDEDIILAYKGLLLPSKLHELLAEYKGRVRGIICDVGTKGSHFSTVAAGEGIVAISGTQKAPSPLPLSPWGEGRVRGEGFYDSVREEELAVIDGGTGKVVVNPQPGTVSKFEEKRLGEEESSNYFKEKAREDAVTQDGLKMDILANADTVEQIREMEQLGGVGVGLVRTEYLYEGAAVPGEEELVELFTKLGKSTSHKVTIRLFDRQPDKEMPCLPDSPLYGLEYYFQDPIGQAVVRAELRAVMRAASISPNIRIMFPQVSTPGDVDRVLELVSMVKGELGIAAAVEIGFMVETPDAVKNIDYLLDHSDFVSIGTNDLTENIFAVKRDDPKSAEYFERLQIPILSSIAQVVDAVRRANAGLPSGAKPKEVSICGDLAHLSAFIPFAVGLSDNQFQFYLSMPPRCIPKVKEIIRHLHSGECRRLFLPILGGRAQGMAEDIHDKAQALIDRILSTIKLKHPAVAGVGDVQPQDPGQAEELVTSL